LGVWKERIIGGLINVREKYQIEGYFHEEAVRETASRMPDI